MDVQSVAESLGVRELRAEQQQCVDSLLAGNDVVALFPTGYGKSMCYQIPCLMSKGAAVVIATVTLASCV